MNKFERYKKATIQSLKNFDSKEHAIKYYSFMLKNNPESKVYPKIHRDFHKSLIEDLKTGVLKC